MLTRLLVVANVAAFVWEVTTGGLGVLSGNIPPNAPLWSGVLVPAAVTGAHQYYRLVTAAFLHGSLVHIAVNMVSLYWLGSFVERIVGPTRFFLIYIVSLFASSLAVVYFSTPGQPTLGASGAIFGLFGALFAIGLKHGRPGMQLIRANIGVLILNLVFTFSFSFISKQAHLGGLLFGFVATLAIYWPRKPVRTRVVDAATGRVLESDVQLPGEAEPLQ
jgi:membrane associated rhomboid family serine protease